LTGSTCRGSMARMAVLVLVSEQVKDYDAWLVLLD
jgi:hypothetical protein